ncbi:fimbrial protein, partial [Escherichia coli]
MGKTISIKVLFGIYFLLMAGEDFSFRCQVCGGASIVGGNTSCFVIVLPVFSA